MPSGYEETGGSFYRPVSTQASVADARADCADDVPGKSRLATFENETEYDNVVGYRSVLGSDYLIGLRGLGASCNGKYGCDQDLQWDDGSTFYGYWFMDHDIEVLVHIRVQGID